MEKENKKPTEENKEKAKVVETFKEEIKEEKAKPAEEITKEKELSESKIVEKEISKIEKETIAQAEKKISEKITDEQKENKKEPEKTEIKTEKKEKKTIEKPKKNEAKIIGKDLSISIKHAIAVCDYIRGKNIERAIKILEPVVNFKQAIPMKGELPHKKGIMGGRYPINAVKEFIKLLKGLNANAIANELELEKYVLFCKANTASRPHRRFGRGKMKRTHVELRLIQQVKRPKKRPLKRK